MKQCSKCKEYKNKSEFSPHKHTRNNDGLHSWCKKCNAGNQARYRKANKEKVIQTTKNCLFKRRYGITLEDYEQAYLEQEGKCLICHKYFDVLCVDHEHQTGKYTDKGKFRGLLCHSCNKLLGFAQENVLILENAMKYLNGEN